MTRTWVFGITGKPYLDWDLSEGGISCFKFSSMLASNWSIRPSIPSSLASRAEAVLSPLRVFLSLWSQNENRVDGILCKFLKGLIHSSSS